MNLSMGPSEYRMEQKGDHLLQLNDTFSKTLPILRSRPLPILGSRSGTEESEDSSLQMNDPFTKPLPTFAHRFGTGPKEDNPLQLNDPFTKTLPTLRPRSGIEEQESRSRTKKKHQPNYWELVMIRHARDLKYLPVPPKDFVSRERHAMEAKNKKHQDRYKVKLRHLQRDDTPYQIPPRRAREALRWVLQPMTEKQPEPKPGVPKITVTDPNGKTWWPKDLNAYIPPNQEAALPERMAKEHRGPNKKAHRAAFKEAYRKGLHNKPWGLRPEVLHCCKCWLKQAEIERKEGLAKEEKIIFDFKRASIEDSEAKSA